MGVTSHADADIITGINMYEFDTLLTTFNPCPRRNPSGACTPNALKKNMDN